MIGKFKIGDEIICSCGDCGAAPGVIKELDEYHKCYEMEEGNFISFDYARLLTPLEKVLK